MLIALSPHLRLVDYLIYSCVKYYWQCEEARDIADVYRHPTFAAAILYKHPFTALDWLEKAFGFARLMAITGATGNMGHAEIKFGDGYIMVDSEWADLVASPTSLGAKKHANDSRSPQRRTRCALRRRALRESRLSGGRSILRQPCYMATDREGHVWSLAQNFRYLSREEAEKASGFKIEGWV